MAASLGLVRPEVLLPSGEPRDTKIGGDRRRIGRSGSNEFNWACRALDVC
jgi:hypothetical protein